MKKITKIILLVLCLNTFIIYESYGAVNPLIEKAKQTKDSQDQYILAKAYFEGDQGLTQDYSQAIIWLNKAHDRKHIEATNLLANMYEKGLGVEQNNNKAISLYKQTADLGNMKGIGKMGVYYYNKQSYVEALEFLKKAHKNGISEATSYLGLMYFQGKGVKRNPKKGIKLILKAANSGDVSAQYLMGSLFYQRKYGMINDKKAKYWLEKASAQGEEKAQFYLAEIYYYGKGCKISYPKAFKWFKKSAEQGNRISQYKVALMYIKGKGVNKDDDQAYYWCKQSMEQGYRKAKTLLEAIEMKRQH